MGRRAARVGAGLALLAVTLTACGGDADDPATGTPASAQSASAEASPEPSGSKDAVSSEGASGSSTASPEASGGSFVPASSEGPAQNVPVPEMPAAAKEQTQEGLEAALEYWWETEYYLRSTGQSEQMVKVSAPVCELCESLTRQWPDLYGAGGWANVKPVTVEVLDARAENGGETGFGTLRVKDAPVAVYSFEGEPFEEASKDTPSDAFWSVTANFSSTAGHWKIADLGVVKVNK
jgi:hypothetical protein